MEGKHKKNQHAAERGAQTPHPEAQWEKLKRHKHPESQRKDKVKLQGDQEKTIEANAIRLGREKTRRKGSEPVPEHYPNSTDR